MIGVLVAVAGGLGAGVRYLVDALITARVHARLPVATLTINVLGSFLLGLLTGWASVVHPDVRSVLGVGFLGGFTTFSTASVELVRLARAQRPVAAVTLALLMIVASLLAAVAGLTLGRAVG